jgi:hypothetical protein
VPAAKARKTAANAASVTDTSANESSMRFDSRRPTA